MDDKFLEVAVAPLVLSLWVTIIRALVERRGTQETVMTKIREALLDFPSDLTILAGGILWIILVLISSVMAALIIFAAYTGLAGVHDFYLSRMRGFVEKTRKPRRSQENHHKKHCGCRFPVCIYLRSLVF